MADFYQYHSKRAQGVLESFSVIIAAVILWGRLEKRAGVWRGLFTFEGFFFFFFFFLSCDYHSQKESVKRRRCILCNSKQVRTRPWVKKKKCDLKQPNIWFFMLVEQALHSFLTLCSDLTLLSNCKVFFFLHPLSPLSLDYKPCLSTTSCSVPFLPLGSLVYFCI